MELKIEYVNKEDLKPYANNAKIHTAEQIEQIKKSIKQFGFNDPIAVWHDDEIIEGHGRLLAVMEMDDIQEVPIIRLDELTDEERRAYMLAHNKLNMNTGFDFGLLELELENISTIDMGDFGFINLDLSYLDEIDGYDEPLNIDNDETHFAITFIFDKKYQQRMLNYISEKGKDKVSEEIAKFICKEDNNA